MKSTAPLSWDDVRVLCAAVAAGSFSRASRALGIDQSTVSRRVATLESAIGQPLFERVGGAVLPTPLLRQLAAPAADVERAMRTLFDIAKGAEAAPVGLVRLALTETLAQEVVIPHVLPGLLASYPGLRVELLTSDAAVDLARQEADLALRFFRTPRGEIVGQRVARLSLAPLATRKLARTWAGRGVGELPWIGYQREGLSLPEERWLTAIGVTPRLVCSSAETQMAAVRAGLGVALAARAQTRAHSELVEVQGLALPELPRLELYIATRRALRRVPRVAVVYDALVQSLRALDG